jgi:hypothetical protein
MSTDDAKPKRARGRRRIMPSIHPSVPIVESHPLSFLYLLPIKRFSPVSFLKRFED